RRRRSGQSSVPRLRYRGGTRTAPPTSQPVEFESASASSSHVVRGLLAITFVLVATHDNDGPWAIWERARIGEFAVASPCLCMVHADGRTNSKFLGNARQVSLGDGTKSLLLDRVHHPPTAQRRLTRRPLSRFRISLGLFADYETAVPSQRRHVAPHLQA